MGSRPMNYLKICWDVLIRANLVMGSITEPPRNPYRHLKSIPECCNKNTVAEEQPVRTRILDPYEQCIRKFPNRKAYNKVHARFPKFSGRMLIHVAGLVDYLYQVSTSAYLALIGFIGTVHR